MEQSLRLAEILNKRLGLTPYESRAYVFLVAYGPMSPSDIAQKARVPRPRAYDVLQGLVEKGLLVEQSGKPSIYAPIEPTQGLKKLLVDVEAEVFKQLEEKRDGIKELTKSLSQMYQTSKHLKPEKSKVWFTQRDTAFITIYAEAIRNCEKEFLVASRGLQIPEKEILEAVESALKKGVTVRVVRQITELWTLEDLQRYKKVIKAGSQVRHLNINQIPLRFMIFDEKDLIIVFPSEESPRTPQNLEALWLRIPPLAKILRENFEELWRKSKPIMPILTRIEQKKQATTK